MLFHTELLYLLKITDKNKIMKAGGSKSKILKKLTKRAYAILDWDNKKANPSIVKRIMSATNQENEIMYDSIRFSEVYQEAVEDYTLEQEKKQISHSLESWDYTLLHTSNLTKKQKKNRAKNKSAKQSRKINRK